MKKALLSLLSGSAIALASGTMVEAAEKITLKLAHPLPLTHYAWQNGIKKFTDTVTEKTNGQVTFEIYPANQLGKDSYGLIKSGLADISMIVTSYFGDKFPLTSVTELPNLYSTSCETTRKFWDLARPGGILDEDEYKPLGIRVLLLNTLPAYTFNTTTKKVETLDEAAGLKMFANGAAMDKSARALGLIPVQMGASEVFDAASRGTIDGALFPYSSLKAYKIDTVIKYSTEGALLGSASWIVAISDKAWNRLPDDVKKVMEEAGPAMQDSLCSWIDTDYDATRKTMQEESGLTVTKLSDEQAKLWHEKLSHVGEQWAKEMDALGKKGTALLEAMKN